MTQSPWRHVVDAGDDSLTRDFGLEYLALPISVFPVSSEHRCGISLIEEIRRFSCEQEMTQLKHVLNSPQDWDLLAISTHLRTSHRQRFRDTLNELEAEKERPIAMFSSLYVYQCQIGVEPLGSVIEGEVRD